jgi:predicted ABC-type ATPase
MASLLVVTGPPGAGKSTAARLLADRAEGPSALVEGDRFFGFLAAGAIEPWRPESRDQNELVIRAAAAAAGVLAAGIETVYDGVLGPWFLPTFAAGTGLARLDYVVLLPSVDECVRRVASRVGHGFSDEAATRKMHAEFAAASVEGRHVLRDPGGIDDVVADIEAARAAGRLVHEVR